jgi:hypothetical protein
MTGTHCSSSTCAADLSRAVAQAMSTASQQWDPQTGDWDVRVMLAGSPELHVHRNAGASPALIAREVGGALVQFSPLTVNGAAVPLEALSRVHFEVDQATTAWGENVYVVGDAKELGAWDTTKAVALSPSAYPNWTGDVALASGKTVSFKFIKRDGAGAVTWESGDNLQLAVPISGAESQSTWR